MKLLAITSLLLVSGCGLIPQNPDVAPEFKIYYAKFLADAAEHRRDLSLQNLVVKFAPLGKDTYGTCSPFKEVKINPNLWKELKADSKEALIYHELGHCTLGRQHLNTYMKDRKPVSLMNSNLVAGYLYVALKDYYLKELYAEQTVSALVFGAHDETFVCGAEN